MLARLLNDHITRVYFLQDFLDVLGKKGEIEGLSNKITTLCCPMDSLSFGDEEVDIIWSERAIYNIGFAKGVVDWNCFLKPGGLLVVSEITWITNTPPAETQKYWES